MYVNVQCLNIYIKNKAFIIRSYISVSSKPSKAHQTLGRFGRNRNITPDNKCQEMLISRNLNVAATQDFHFIHCMIYNDLEIAAYIQIC